MSVPLLLPSIPLIDWKDAVSSAAGQQVVAFLYPPFNAGIEIPLTTPCSVLFGLKHVGVKLAKKRTSNGGDARATKGPHVADRGLGPAAILDDATALATDTSACRAVVVRGGAYMSSCIII